MPAWGISLILDFLETFLFRKFLELLFIAEKLRQCSVLTFTHLSATK